MEDLFFKHFPGKPDPEADARYEVLRMAIWRKEQAAK